MPELVRCEGCEGSGRSRPGSAVHRILGPSCPDCGGTGTVHPKNACAVCGMPFWADWEAHAWRHSQVIAMQRAASACLAAGMVDLADEALRRIAALNRQEKKAS